MSLIDKPLTFDVGLIQLSFHTMCSPDTIYKTRPKKHFKNEQRSKDAAAKKRPNTSGVYRKY